MQAALKIFAENLPRRPYCTNEPREGQTVRGRDEALSFSHLQPNTSGKVVWLAFDVDQPDGATCWSRLSAPPPTLAIENPRNGHAHLLYALETPVPRTDAARAKPLLYLAAAQEGIRRKLRADPGYSGHLCKNPLHPRWQTQQWATTYTLADLAEWVDLPRIADMKKRVSDPDYAGLGRNCELFERLRTPAYSLVRRFWIPGGFEHFRDALRALAEDFNAGFAVPLPMAEVRAISASCARWIWKHFDPAAFRAIQSKRGARKGADKRALLLPEVLRLIGEGRSQREVAAAVGVSAMSVSRWLAGDAE
jgi:hypothetical protein